jgi:hypothetical protein
MESRHLFKIRLKEDGTWEHVYSYSDKITENMNHNYQTMSRDEILEEAVELSHYKDAIELIAYIKNK